jgi:hypothetical protein
MGQTDPYVPMACRPAVAICVSARVVRREVTRSSSAQISLVAICAGARVGEVDCYQSVASDMQGTSAVVAAVQCRAVAQGLTLQVPGAHAPGSFFCQTDIKF